MAPPGPAPDAAVATRLEECDLGCGHKESEARCDISALRLTYSLQRNRQPLNYGGKAADFAPP